MIEFCTKCGLVSITVLRMNGESLCSRCTNKMKAVNFSMGTKHIESDDPDDPYLIRETIYKPADADLITCKNCGKKHHVNACHICEKKEDLINKPNHYHSSGIDPIAIGESMFTKEEMQGFYKMNMLKYWFRAGKKEGNSKDQDLQKYEFYSNKLRESVER